MEQAATQAGPVEKFFIPGREPGEGFYWYFVDASDDSPVVVQVNSEGDVTFCGAEAVWYLPSTGRSEYVIEGLFVGPIAQPSIKQGKLEG
ncbi:hypothetical protein [Paraburkholderia sp. J8-2]|uniref:hypothetical protein n=1 Tax=Paraburkholderia sp. J8-2 TaxID=2805440 RepID=UPI002AB6A730|nr:hypothetical protein [Paraburkholderia sp. J8-2]